MEQKELLEQFSERTKLKLRPTVASLFMIGETLVDVSKSHISAETAIDRIRECMDGAICSKYRLDKLFDELIEDFLEEQNET